MTSRSLRQRGATLVVSLIMLIVLTLLAVSAVRFGLINLRIAGNVQADTEATAAAQIAVEQVIEQMVAASSVDAIAAAPNTQIDVGAKTLTVNVSKPACLVSVPVLNSQLDPSKAADVPCFEGADQDKAITSTGALSSTPSSCNQQQWDIQADVTDSVTGANVTVHQGVSIRVPAQTACN